jgi:hypothetical protein
MEKISTNLIFNMVTIANNNKKTTIFSTRFNQKKNKTLILE